MSAPAPPIVAGVSALAPRYDGFILDLWGVIHDGVTLYPGVADCLGRLRLAGKKFVMLSNAPRRGGAIAGAMERMGLAAELCQNILSSGDATYDGLKQRSDPWFARLGRRCLHIGPERDRNLFDGLDIVLVAAVTDAEFIVNTGPWLDDETVADYESRLVESARSGLPMVCANPDLEVIRGGKRIICAGALARRYEALGGEVRYFGKPHPAIYDNCFAALAVTNRAKILAIGDSLRTDIAGANAAGIASALVLGGLHAAEFGAGPGRTADLAAVARACQQAAAAPDVLLPGFVW